jgi:hypothetical protein
MLSLLYSEVSNVLGYLRFSKQCWWRIRSSVISCHKELSTSDHSVTSRRHECSVCFALKSSVWYFKESFICISFVMEWLIKVNGWIYIPLISNPIIISPSVDKNQSYCQFSLSYTKPFCKKSLYKVTCWNFIKHQFSPHTVLPTYHDTTISQHMFSWGKDSVTLSWDITWDYYHDTLLGKA